MNRFYDQKKIGVAALITGLEVMGSYNHLRSTEEARKNSPKTMTLEQCAERVAFRILYEPTGRRDWEDLSDYIKGKTLDEAHNKEKNDPRRDQMYRDIKKLRDRLIWDIKERRRLDGIFANECYDGQYPIKK